MARSLRKFNETLEIRSLLIHRLRAHRYFPIAVIAAILLAAACLHIWQRVVVINLVQDVSRLQKENRSLVDDAHKIRTDIASLSMASRIEQYAIDSLGLQRVRMDQIITLVPEESAEIPDDRLATMVSSIKRIADYLPAMSEAKAASDELKPIRFEPGDTGAGE